MNFKFKDKMMADITPDNVEGNLYQITLGRITNITEEDDICQDPYNLEFASEELKNDPELKKILEG